MEPFEWLLLGVGVAIGSIFSGSRGKSVVRSAAKGYLVVEEKTREWTANMREDFRDAVEEARYERDQQLNQQDLEDEEEDEERSQDGKRPVSHASGTRAHALSRNSTAKKRSSSNSESDSDGEKREPQASGKEKS